MTLEEKGSIVFVIGLLAEALSWDDKERVSLAKVQLNAVFPPYDGTTPP